MLRLFRVAIKWCVVSIAFLIVFIVLLSFLIGIVLLIPPVQEKALEWCQNEIDLRFDNSIKIESVSTNLFTFLTVKNISIANHAVSDDSIFIETLHLDYILPLVLRKKLVINKIEISNSHSTVSIDSSGENRLANFLRTEIEKNRVQNTIQHGKRSSHWEIILNRLIISNVHGTFKDDKHGQFAKIPHADIHGTFSHNNVFDFKINIADGEYTSSWWCGNISTFKGAAVLSDTGVVVSELLIDADSSMLRGKGMVPFTGDGLWSIEVAASSDIKSLPILHQTLPELEHSGSVSANVTWVGTMQQPVLTVATNIKDAHYRKLFVSQLAISASYGRGDSLEAEFAISSDAGKGTGNCFVVINKLMSSDIRLKEYNSTITIDNFSTEKASSAIKRFSQIPGEIKGSSVITLAGDGIDKLPENISLYSKLTYDSLFTDTVSTTINVSGNTWSVSCQLDKNTLFAQGTLAGYKTINGNISVKIPSPMSLTAPFIRGKTTGDIHLFADIKGPILTPDISLVCNVSKGSWRGNYLDTCYARIRITKEKQTIDSVNCFLRTNGKSISALSGRNIRGNFSCRASGSGELSKPDLKFDVIADSFSLGKNSMGSFTSSIRINDLDSVYLDSAVLNVSTLRKDIFVSGKGAYRSKSAMVKAEFVKTSDTKMVRYGDSGTTGYISIVADTLSIDTSSVNIEITSLALHEISDGLKALHGDISGNVSMNTTISGALSNPSITMKMGAEKLRYKDFTISRSVSGMKLNDSLMRLYTTIWLSDEDSVIIKGDIPFSPGDKWKIDRTGLRNATLSLKTGKIPLSKWYSSSDASWSIGGTSSMAIDMGIKNGKTVLDGIVDVSNGDLRSRRYTATCEDINVNMILSGALDSPYVSFRTDAGPIKYRGAQVDRLNVLGVLTKDVISLYSAKLTVGDSSVIRIEGAVPIGKQEPLLPIDKCELKYTVNNFPLPVAFAPLVDNLLFDGVVNGNGTVHFKKDGTPKVSGEMSVADVMIVSENINPPLGPINAAVVLNEDTVTIRNLHALWGKGTIDLQGIVVTDTETLPFVDVEATVTDVAWLTPDVLHGAVNNAHLRCLRESDSYSVSGNVQLGTTRYIQDIQITEVISRLQNTTVRRTPSLSTSIADKFNLAVAVDLQDNAAIDINLGNIKMDGQCMVTGSVAHPSYTGEITVTDGYILYLDRQFEIGRATIANYNKKELNPSVNLEASAIVSVLGEQTENYTIILLLKGSMKNPVFSLKDQTGSLNELEIISILTLGQPIGGMSGDIKDRLKVVLQQSILGFGSRKLEQFLGIDKIDVKGDIFSGKGVAKNTRLTIAKRVTPRLMVLYEGDIGKNNRPKISALYRIANNIFLSGETDNESESGVDIIFKFSK